MILNEQYHQRKYKEIRQFCCIATKRIDVPLYCNSSKGSGVPKNVKYTMSASLKDRATSKYMFYNQSLKVH